MSPEERLNVIERDLRAHFAKTGVKASFQRSPRSLTVDNGFSYQVSRSARGSPPRLSWDVAPTSDLIEGGFSIHIYFTDYLGQLMRPQSLTGNGITVFLGVSGDESQDHLEYNFGTVSGLRPDMVGSICALIEGGRHTR